MQDSIPTFRVGVDVGGTFTDAVAYDDETRSVRYAKVPSTPGDPAEAVIAALDALDIGSSDIDRFVHGITIGTNAILEGKGAEVWMLVTRGFRDVLEIARTNRATLYDITTLKPPPIVPRKRTVEIDERIMFDGSVLAPLDEDRVQDAIDRLSLGPDAAVVVCFLHSYAFPGHERRVAALLRETHRHVFVCTSSDVLPQFREYERFNTAALNAYIGPLMNRYLTDLEDRLRDRGYGRNVFIMTSNGGVSTAGRARRLPIATVLSGPAGGVAATLHLGSRSGVRNLITCDMGGTSTDVCLISDLQVPVTNEQTIGPYANRTPQIEINAVGAGGGSIAWLDAGDILMVGPQSAGAVPGPACYGQGGTDATVTDANLVLNRLKSGSRLAGHIALDRDRALAAMGPLMAKLGLEADALAEGIVRIAVARMVSAIKQISIAKGFDPRDFVLCSYGGAGPMHAAIIADEMDISRVVLPRGPGNFAAFGSLISDIRQDHVLTRTLQPARVGFAEVDRVFRGMEDEGRAQLQAEGVAAENIVVRRSLGMRYLGQSWELDVDIPDDVQSAEAIDAAFHAVHDRRFGHRSAGATEIVTFRIAAIGRVAPLALPTLTGGGDPAAAIVERRSVYFDGAFRDTPVFDRDRIPPEAAIEGPAIIEEAGATTVLPPAWRGYANEHGDLMLERR